MKVLNMTEGSPWKLTLKFALPVFAGNALQQLYNTVDTIIAGNFAGQQALSAVGTTGSFTFFLLAIGMGLSSGCGVIVSQRFGAGDEKGIRKTASTGILMMLALGLLITGLAIAIARPAFIHFISVPEEIYDQTMLYFIIYAVGLVFQYGYSIIASILRAVGDSASTLYFLIVASVVNIVLDILFVAGFHWGVAGAAIATIVSELASFIAAYLYMVRKYPIFRFKLKEFTWDGIVAKQTVRIGFPISLQMMVVAFGLTFIQRAVNEFGETMTASYTVAQRMEMYLNLPSMAFQTTLATYVGQNIGANRMDRVKKGVRQTILMSVAVTLVISVLLWIFAGAVVKLFGVNDAAAEYCMAHLRAIAFVNFILNAYVPLFGLFQGANHVAIPTVIAIVVLTIRVIITFLLRHSAFFGHTIIWWNGLFGFTVGFIMTYAFYLTGGWQKNSLIKTSTENT